MIHACCGDWRARAVVTAFFFFGKLTPIRLFSLLCLIFSPCTGVLQHKQPYPLPGHC